MKTYPEQSITRWNRLYTREKKKKKKHCSASSRKSELYELVYASLKSSYQSCFQSLITAHMKKIQKICVRYKIKEYQTGFWYWSIWCMFVDMHMCACMCACVSMCVCVACVCMHAYVHLCVCAFKYVCLCACVCAHARACEHMCACIDQIYFRCCSSGATFLGFYFVLI